VNRVRQRRLELNLSQVRLGLRAGLANTTVSDFELGKRQPWPKARRALAEALGVSEAELFSDQSAEARVGG